MSMTRSLAAVLGAALTIALVAPGASAGTYPTQSCVSAKLKSIAKQCQADLKVWSTWETTQNDGVRDTALAGNAAKLAADWTKAEAKATAKGADCVETTLTSSETSAAITAGVNDIVTAINDGLTLSNQADGKCGTALVKAASKKCGAFFKAESTWIKKLDKDPQGAARDEARDKADIKFAASFAKALAPGCPTTATAITIEDKVDDLTDQLVIDSTTSPHLATTWTQVDAPAPGGTVAYDGQTLQPICSRGTPYIYWAKRGSEDGVKKLLVYYQGGGACWDSLTCADATGAFDDEVVPGDNPANTTTGFGDLTNPANPFHDWNAVFISYCTGDVHWGHNFKGYGSFSIRHNGFDNAK
ncbi:MAG: hypothetical protein HY953_08040, partial [Candidatus Rokubacteria bacterium]|nr:hypothetical protein [Candidatus Rokubacteria bacterium]